MIEQLIEALCVLLADRGGKWRGTSAELFSLLDELPLKSARGLAKTLSRNRDHLAAAGIELDFKRETRGQRRSLVILQRSVHEPDDLDPDQDNERDPHYVQAIRDSLAKDREREESRDRIRGCVVYTPGSDRKYKDF